MTLPEMPGRVDHDCRKIVAQQGVGSGTRGRRLEWSEGRCAAWHADERRDRRGRAFPLPGIVEDAESAEQIFGDVKAHSHSLQ
jgi:hypothetical protein